MVNSKKINKSTVAIVVLSLLLVLSLVLTATGAWFTDKETSSTQKDFTFGTVSVALSGSAESGAWTATGTGAKVVPGSSFTTTLTLSNDGDQDVWVRAATQTATLTVGEKTLNDVAGITVTIELDTKGANKDAVAHSSESGVYGLAATKKQDFKVTVTIDKEVANTVKVGEETVVLNNGSDAGVSGTLAVNLVIEAVQQANNTAATFPTNVAESVDLAA